MTILERLAGCPSGATRNALLACGHSNVEINEAVLCGRVRRVVRDYAMPRDFKVEWFYLENGK